MPQLREKPCQGFETKKTAWKPGPNVCNSTAAIGMRAGLVLEGVRKTYRARYYNPATGRFLSEDPIGFAGGFNLYAYANENPLSFNDPFGTCAKYSCTTDAVILFVLALISIALFFMTPFSAWGMTILIIDALEYASVFGSIAASLGALTLFWGAGHTVVCGW